MQWRNRKTNTHSKLPALGPVPGHLSRGAFTFLVGAQITMGGVGVPCNLWSRSVADVQENVFLWLRDRALL